MKALFKMRYCFKYLVLVMSLGISVAVLAQGPTYKLGRTPSQEEIRALDISISSTGKELPPGSGTAKEGVKIYAKQCAQCHGPTAAEGSPSVQHLRLVGGKDTIGTLHELRTVGSVWPFATTLWDYINRAMPPGKEEGLLTPDDVYALTAYLLYRNDIIKESDVIDAKSLPKIQMPNRNGFYPTPWREWKPGVPRQYGQY